MVNIFNKNTEELSVFWNTVTFLHGVKLILKTFMHTFCIYNHLDIFKTTNERLRGMLSVVEKVSVRMICLMNVICIYIMFSDIEGTRLQT